MPKAKAKITLDHLAQMSQREFTSIHDEVKGVKEEVKGVKEEVKILREDIGILRNDMEAGFQSVSSSMRMIIEQLNEIRAELVDQHDLRSRVERLEKKMELRR